MVSPRSRFPAGELGVRPKMTIKSEQDTTAGFTTRVLLSLVNDLADAQAAVARITVQIGTLAALHGVKMVDPETM